MKQQGAACPKNFPHLENKYNFNKKAVPRSDFISVCNRWQYEESEFNVQVPIPIVQKLISIYNFRT